MQVLFEDLPFLPAPQTRPIVPGNKTFDTVINVSLRGKPSKRARDRERVVCVENDRRHECLAGSVESKLMQAYEGIAEFSETSSSSSDFHKKTKFDEFSNIFAPRGYDNAFESLSLTSTVRLLSIMQLSSADRFVDLGSSFGRIALAAALLSPASSILGVELSPTQHRVACQARARLIEAGSVAAQNVTFLQGDVLEAPLTGSTVAWCGMRERQMRKMKNVFSDKLHSSIAPGARLRLLTAGFEIPNATLHASYIFTDDQGGPMNLYGPKTHGPKLIMEYHIHGPHTKDLKTPS